MLQAIIKLCLPKLNGLLLIVALTGFVCTHKIQAEEECLSSNVLCYECDSRYDPNCADPFDFSMAAMMGEPKAAANDSASLTTTMPDSRLAPAEATNQTTTTTPRTPKKLPHVAVCHGCCVKITSRTPDGVSYVKRTCTTNLQINYFMVGLVCMKESGDRGKMCFCEQDYCNGSKSSLLLLIDQPPHTKLVLTLILLLTTTLLILKSRTY